MPRLPKRKTEKLAFHKALGETLGKLQAEYRFKHTKKGWLKSIRDHIGKWIDNLNPLELAATIGLTIIIKTLIDKSEEIRGWLETTGGLYAEFETFLGRQTLLKPIGQALGLKEIEKGSFEGVFPDWMDWLIAFTLAYIIIKHGGQLLGFMKEGSANLLLIVKALLGMPIA
jgi:hypothetical protein